MSVGKMGVKGEAQESFELEERNAQIYEQWAVWSKSHRVIAKEFGISQQRVSQIIAEYRSKNPAVREELAAQSIAVLKELHRRQLALAEQIKAGAPVAVGKDGNKLYEDDGTPVRDYSGYLRALAEVRATDAQIAKRMGLDAPDRLEATQTVKYVIEGVEGDALT